VLILALTPMHPGEASAFRAALPSCRLVLHLYSHFDNNYREIGSRYLRLCDDVCKLQHPIRGSA